MDEAVEEWFMREILPHESALTRYLRYAWPVLDEVADLRQEIYIKVMESAEKARPLSPRHYLFTLARNHVIDLARHHRIVPIDLSQDVDALNVLIDEVSPERHLGSFEQLARFVAAVDQLPDRCREVVWLRKIEDVPQKEIALRLKVSEGTVEGHLVRGMRLLTKWFYEGDSDERAEESPAQHGAPRQPRRRRP